MDIAIVEGMSFFFCYPHKITKINVTRPHFAIHEAKVKPLPAHGVTEIQTGSPVIQA